MKKIITIILMASVTGCTYQKFQLDDKAATIPTHEGTNHFVFWGLGQTKEVDPNEVCGSRGTSSVETRYSFVDGLLTGITYGIYSPRTYAVYCKPAK
jgi:hypothetical protein